MCKTDNIKLPKTSKQLNQPIFSPDKVATSCSVEAVSDDEKSSSDYERLNTGMAPTCNGKIKIVSN